MNSVEFEFDEKNPVQLAIVDECKQLAELLIRKNIEYGSSALEPLRIFSGASTEEQIRVRIDDKLSRICTTSKMTSVKVQEDTVQDLMGYLVLLRVYQRLKPNQK